MARPCRLTDADRSLRCVVRPRFIYSVYLRQLADLPAIIFFPLLRDRFLNAVNCATTVESIVIFRSVCRVIGQKDMDSQ